MTIGYVLDDTLDRSDGVQQAMLAIGEHVRSLGHDVHYIVAETVRTDIQNVHSVGGFVSLPFNGNSVRTPKPANAKIIKDLFKEINFDVLHVQMPFSPFLAAKVLAAAPKNVVRVGTFHVLPYNRLAGLSTRMLGRLVRKTINSLDKCYAVSEPAKVFMKQSFGVDGEILPNPVDYSFFSSFKKQKSKHRQIVFVGRFEERKGVEQLVDAYSLLDEKIRNTTRLTMCGVGPLLEKVSNTASSLKLNIDFPGFVDNKTKAQYLANADVAVFPSISGESFGIVLAEAMAAGAGITIGGNNPGYKSVLGNWPEVLFDPLDIEAFSKKLKQLLINSNDAQSIGKQQHVAAKAYDIEVIVKRLFTEAYKQKS